MACSSIFAMDFSEFYLSKTPLTDDLISEKSIALLKKKAVFRTGANIKRKMLNLFTRLEMRCQAEMQHEALPLGKDPEQTLLKAGMENLIQNGFSEALHADLTNMMYALQVISAATKREHVEHLPI